MTEDLFTEMSRRYREGGLPWDDPLSPPEVIAIAEHLPPGRALDLGCGYGRVCIYLAQRGWECDGVDFVPQAIEAAQERAHAAGVSDHARFHVGPVTDLSFLQPSYDLAVDVGCLHAQRGDDLHAYVAEVARLLKPGGLFLLFVRLLDEFDSAAPRGLPEPAIRALFEPDFIFERVEHGTSHMADESWASAWFWLRRRQKIDD
jgi:SAM-dependent methyltransferase